MGPVGINYGVIALPDMSSGNLYLDDEDHNNKNWAQRWLGNRYQADLGNSGCYFGSTKPRIKPGVDLHGAAGELSGTATGICLLSPKRSIG